MTAKLFTANSEFGSIGLNVSDEKTEWGVVKSISFTPRNATGEFFNVNINARYAEKVAAFNAATYAYFNLYDMTEGLHLYGEHNSRKLDGGLGWIDLLTFMNRKGNDGLPLFQKDSEAVTSIITLNGQTVFIEWPSRKAWHDGRGVYHFRPVPDSEAVRLTTMGERPWARLISQGPNRVKVMIEEPNDKAEFPGDLLHTYLDHIRRGVKITLPATNKRWTTNFETKEFKMLTGIQDKVAWLYRNLTVEGYDYESHKAKWAADRIVFNTTIRVHEQMLKDVELGSDDPNAAEILTARAEGKVTGRVIMVDGKKVDLGAFKAGTYRVFTKDGKPYSSQPVALAHTNGMDLLSRFYAKGFKLETVLVYEKAK